MKSSDYIKTYEYRYVYDLDKEMEKPLNLILKKISPEDKGAMEFKILMEKIIEFVISEKVDMNLHLISPFGRANFILSARRFFISEKHMELLGELLSKADDFSIDRISNPWGADICIKFGFFIDKKVVQIADKIENDITSIFED